MTEFEGTFFDMDGVVVETAHVWRDVEQTHIFPAAIESGEMDYTAIRGLSIDNAYDRLDEMEGVTLAVDREGFRQLYDEHAPIVYREQARLMDGFDDIVATLRRSDQTLGLVSASRRTWIEMVLDRFDLHDRYDVVVSADDVDRSKPAPECYELAAAHVDVSPTRALAIEDSPHGIEAAKNAGMYCLAIRGPGNQDLDLSLADDVVAGPDALRRTLHQFLEAP